MLHICDKVSKHDPITLTLKNKFKFIVSDLQVTSEKITFWVGENKQPDLTGKLANKISKVGKIPSKIQINIDKHTRLFIEKYDACIYNGTEILIN
jgi:hypothetical protein